MRKIKVVCKIMCVCVAEGAGKIFKMCDFSLLQQQGYMCAVQQKDQADTSVLTLALSVTEAQLDHRVRNVRQVAHAETWVCVGVCVQALGSCKRTMHMPDQ